MSDECQIIAWYSPAQSSTDTHSKSSHSSAQRSLWSGEWWVECELGSRWEKCCHRHCRRGRCQTAAHPAPARTRWCASIIQRVLLHMHAHHSPWTTRTCVSPAGLGMRSMTRPLWAAGRPSSRSATSMAEACVMEEGSIPPAPESTSRDRLIQHEGWHVVVARAVYVDLVTRTTVRARRMPDVSTASCPQLRLSHTHATKKENKRYT